MRDDPNIFTDPPDRLGAADFYFGTFVVGIGGMEGIEVARAFAEAADRLLTAAAQQRESWEAAYPILYCYRHALELHLKALLPSPKHGHRLADLAEAIKPALQRYPPKQVAWLLERIAEFDRLDPKSTVFRYPDGHQTSYKPGAEPDPEMWVDFRKLQRTANRVFQGLERVRLHQHSTE